MHWTFEESQEISELCHTERWRSIESMVKSSIKLPMDDNILHLVLVRLGMCHNYYKFVLSTKVVMRLP